jgi:hypothetical protein
MAEDKDKLILKNLAEISGKERPGKHDRATLISGLRRALGQ